MIIFKLFAEFFKIGLFSFGGGYATIPFLYHISEIHSWYSLQELSQIVAVASITPGPVGINAATYAGFKTFGIFGALTATMAEVIPSLVLVIIVSKLLKNFSGNFYVKAAIETLKPISCALLLSVVIALLREQIHNYCGIILLLTLLLLSWKSKKDPIFYILISAVAGVLLPFINC